MNNVNSLLYSYGDIPVIGIAGYSGSGKTTLIEKLIKEFNKHGLSIGVIKHDVHGIADNDIGKDSFRLSAAGAAGVVLCSPVGPALEEAIAMLSDVDLILVEGFKKANIVKLGISRKACGKGFCGDYGDFAALVTDEELSCSARCDMVCFEPDDVGEICKYIITMIQK